MLTPSPQAGAHSLPPVTAKANRNSPQQARMRPASPDAGLSTPHAAKPTSTLKQTTLQTALLTLCILAAGYAYGWQSMVFTTMVTALSFTINLTITNSLSARKCLAYLLFFLTPFLTSINAINTLTGLNPSGAERYWFGITFASASLAVFIYEGKLSLDAAIFQISQPLRLFSGPVAIPHPRIGPKPNTILRLLIYGSWFNLGMFFFFVLAPALTPFFALKRSTNPLDTLIFATAYELYVYFNFAGISFVAYALLRAFGVTAVLNFNTPFAARSLIEYWQRWHISLSQVCKLLFFRPIRDRLSLPIAVIAVFLSSAMWHGTSLNFLIWGIFHALGWIVSYALLTRCLYGKILATAILPFFVIIGRLIFSEIDPHLLFIKLGSLMTADLSDPPLVRDIVLSNTAALLLVVALAVIWGEAAKVRSFRRYRIYRTGWNSIALLVFVIFFGSSGLGGIYGAR